MSAVLPRGYLHVSVSDALVSHKKHHRRVTTVHLLASLSLQ